jgi:hypothetical protein
MPSQPSLRSSRRRISRPASYPRSGPGANSAHGLEQLGRLRPHHRRGSIQGQCHRPRLAPAIRLEVRRHRRRLVHGQSPRPHLEEKQISLERQWPADSRPTRFPRPPTAPDSSRSPTGSTRRASNSAFISCAAFPARWSPPICPSLARSFHAADAADTTSPCPWDEGNWGIKDNAAGQAYYDSMIRSTLLGPRLPQGRLHLRPSLPAHRDSPDRRSHPQNRPAHRALALARPHSLEHAAEVANTRRCGASPTITGTDGPSAQARDRVPFGLQGDVRSPGQVVRLHQPRQLA